MSRVHLEAPSRRQLLIGGSMLAAAGVAYARTPRTSRKAIGKDELEKVIPLRIGKWSYETKSGLVLPPPDQLAATLYDQMLTRVYVSPDDLPVMLLIAYGSTQNGMLQVHRPEICYPASGYKLSAGAPTTTPVASARLQDVPSRFFTAVGETRTEQLLYWIRIGRSFPLSWAQERLAVVRENLDGIIPDGVLVRVSTITGDSAAAEATLKKFAGEMVATAPGRGKGLLLGTQNMV